MLILLTLLFMMIPLLANIKDQDNEPMKRTFYEQELQLFVEPKTYRIEKVIRKKEEGDHVLLYIKWKSSPHKFNSYVF